MITVQRLWDFGQYINIFAFESKIFKICSTTKLVHLWLKERANGDEVDIILKFKR